jgi:hypothetical protein
MKIYLHCHSQYSNDNFFKPEELILQAVKRKLDGVCFTEHHSVNASLPVARIKVPEGFYVFRGMEISTNRSHLLVYGLKDDSWNLWSRSQYLDIDEVLKLVRNLGGICVPAHPFRGWDSIGEEIYNIDGIDAIETHNGLNADTENRKAIQAARIKNLPSIGGSDCHNQDQVGLAFTVFDNSVHTMRELISEIKKGKCRGLSLPKDLW